MSESEPTTKNNVIRRGAVRMVGQPAMLDCGTIVDGKAGKPLAIVPVMDGDRVAGFEVRCGCGASAIVECVYEHDPRPLPTPSPDPLPEETEPEPAPPPPTAVPQ